MAKITETIPFNFNEIYTYVENKFIEKGYDTQEGSNSMQLVTAMSYLTSMLNANTAVNINELLLPIARNRNNILEDARVLGYEIDHIRSYQYNVVLNFTNDELTPVVKTIQKYTKFTAGSYDYYYMGDELDITVPAGDGSTAGTFDQSIVVIEGDLKRFETEATLTVSIEILTDSTGVQTVQHYVDIPFTDVEQNGIEVYLTYYNEAGEFRNQEPWSKTNNFMIEKDTILNKEYVRLDNIEYRTPRIYFKLGDVGKEVRVGTIIEMNALISSGNLGLMTVIPTVVDLDATVTSYSLELEGASEESIESIKQNAPLFHNTANRIITKPDYIAFCNRLAKIQYTDVWDGHDEFPNRAGFIWFSFLTSNIVRNIISETAENTTYNMQNLDDKENWYLDEGKDVDGNIDQDIQEVYDYLKNYNVPTLKFYHRNPVFFEFVYNINILKYNAVKTKAERNDLVFTVINEYFKGFDENNIKTVETPVETFVYEYFQSNLNKRIDTELTDLMGFNISATNSVYLNERNIINDELGSLYDSENMPVAYYKEIRFHLGIPYEDIYDSNNDIITENIPDITSLNFVNTDTLYVDYTTGVSDIVNKIRTYSIRLGDGDSSSPSNTDTIIGQYKIFSGVVNDIEIVLNVVSDNAHTLGLDEADIIAGLNIDISYPSPNIKFARNTIPRLKQVNFI
jgi:hypothetical protein